MTPQSSVWETYVIPHLKNQPPTTVRTTQTEYRDVVLSQDRSAITYRRQKQDGSNWSDMKVTKQSLIKIWTWLNTPIEERSKQPPGCESNVSKKHITMWALGLGKENGLVTKDLNNHYILRKGEKMTFDHNTLYLKVDHDLFSSIFAELGWEQTNDGGVRGDKRNARTFQGRNWSSQWCIDKQKYVYLAVEISQVEETILIKLVLHKDKNSNAPSAFASVEPKDFKYKTVTSKIFPAEFNHIKPEALISWNEREALKEAIRNNLEAIQNGQIETNINVSWPEELPLVTEPPTVWWAVNLVDYDTHGNQIPYQKEALEENIVGIGWLTPKHFKQISLTEPSSLDSQINSVLDNSKATNKCVGFLSMRSGDKVILLDGGSPVWIGTATDTVIHQDSYKQLQLSHLFRPVEWRQQIGTYTLMQAQTNTNNPNLHTTVRQAIFQEISAENSTLDCKETNIMFSAKTLDTPKQNYDKMLFSQSYNNDTLHHKFIEQRAKTFDPTTYTMIQHISNVTTPPVKPNPVQPSTETTIRIEDLQQFQNIVFEGVPGTGKTFAVDDIVRHWTNDEEDRQVLMGKGQGKYATTFHPSTSYEDFVEGLKPRTNQNDNDIEPKWFTDAPIVLPNSQWVVQDGFFLKVCKDAFNNPQKDFIILIDEINRANVPKVLGDLLTTIERSKRASFVTTETYEALEQPNTERFVQTTNGYWDTKDCQVVSLPYSQRKFFVPNNIYIIATMNTTDRSVAPLDAALRRRFAFLRIEPMNNDTDDTKTGISTVINEQYGNQTLGHLSNSVDTWCKLNHFLKDKIGPDGMLGHSYLLVLAKEIFNKKKHIDRQINKVWEREIIPQLIDTLMVNNKHRECMSDSQNNKNTINSILKEMGYRLTLHGSGLSEMLTIDSISTAKDDVSDDIKDVEGSESDAGDR